MAFDSNLILVDGSAVWSKANLDSYGVPDSTTRNAGGFVVLDVKESGVKPLSAVVMLPAANAAGDALTLTIEGSDSATFASGIHEVVKFDIAAATLGVILGSECPATVVRNFITHWRYLRAKATCTAADDFGLAKVFITDGPFKRL